MTGPADGRHGASRAEPMHDRTVRTHSRIPLFNRAGLRYDARHCPDAVVAELVDAQR